MSHVSGFRKGGADFTHGPNGPGTRRTKRRTKSERLAERRFRDHERTKAAHRPEAEED